MNYKIRTQTMVYDPAVRTEKGVYVEIIIEDLKALAERALGAPSMKLRAFDGALTFGVVPPQKRR